MLHQKYLNVISKDVLHRVGDVWVQEWYHWRDIQLKEAMRVWFESVLEEIADEKPLP